MGQEVFEPGTVSRTARPGNENTGALDSYRCFNERIPQPGYSNRQIPETAPGVAPEHIEFCESGIAITRYVRRHDQDQPDSPQKNDAVECFSTIFYGRDNDRSVHLDQTGQVLSAINPDGSYWRRGGQSDDGRGFVWHCYSAQGAETNKFKGNVSYDQTTGTFAWDQTYPVPQRFKEEADGSYVHQFKNGATETWDPKTNVKTIYYPDEHGKIINVRQFYYCPDQATGQLRVDHFTDRKDGTTTYIDAEGQWRTRKSEANVS
jgi:hypothetical protein